ncbi:hypothetical protein NYF23_08265 [SAR92 clade bacterium H455]|uniref:Lipoprotein n=1 Tax=SAR92 clade bacterium H455 TaxID=2974818 RepID=A0ABY5TJH7_9GAMM|nr:hypothetical protein NYF23_08265 [SAR92 clade bacterium H455]
MNLIIGLAVSAALLAGCAEQSLEQSTDMQAAAVMERTFAQPAASSTLYDGMRVNVWSSVEARNTGWKDWAEHYAEAFGDTFSSTLLCNDCQEVGFDLYSTKRMES